MFYGVPLTLGVEEEYQIVDPTTYNLYPFSEQLIEQGKGVVPDGELKPEFMQCQVEVGTPVCQDIHDVRRELLRLRRTVCDIASANDLRIIAASTHPFASWESQVITEGERYSEIIGHMQEVARQLLIFGMHIHVGFGSSPENKSLMIEVMNQLRYFLPHILALSSSSPMWQGKATGLKSYRSVIFEMLPRTGIPQAFKSFAEYENFVKLLGKVGSIGAKDHFDPADATKIWWDVRPHPKFDTLEVRISDICTNVEHAISITALVQALTAKLIKLRKQNLSWRGYRRMHIIENKWRAMRFGIEGQLIDFGLEDEVPFPDLIQELIALVDDVVDELGCREEVANLAKIVENGTSAENQLRVFEEKTAAGATVAEAQHAVAEYLAKETVLGVLD